MTVHHRRTVKRRAMLLLAAAVAIAAVFFAGLGVGNHGSGKNAGSVLALKLTGTQGARHAEGLLQVWNSRDGSNWPMTLSVAGLPELGPHTYYEVYLFRDGKIAGSCGTFRVGSSDSSGAVTVTLTSPYQLRRGDSWVVTRPGPGGAEPGKTVLRPVTA
jgi:hypothetical protein